MKGKMIPQEIFVRKLTPLEDYYPGWLMYSKSFTADLWRVSDMDTLIRRIQGLLHDGHTVHVGDAFLPDPEPSQKTTSKAHILPVRWLWLCLDCSVTLTGPARYCPACALAREKAKEDKQRKAAKEALKAMVPTCLMCDCLIRITADIQQTYLCDDCVRKLQVQREERRHGKEAAERIDEHGGVVTKSYAVRREYAADMSFAGWRLEEHIQYKSGLTVTNHSLYSSGSNMLEVVNQLRAAKWVVDTSTAGPMEETAPKARRAEDTKEKVNHPSHYGGDTTHEVVKCLKAWGLENDALLWNVCKYVARTGKKDDVITELKKAAWYLQRKIADLVSERERQEKENA